VTGPTIIKHRFPGSSVEYHFSVTGHPIIYHAGISGGKDSDALILWLVHESGIPPEQIRVSFSDTKNEHEYTYQQVALINERVFPVETLEPELGFYDLALKKRRFPSRRARFCTQWLKMKPTAVFLDALWELGYDVIACSGVRREESEERKTLPLWSPPLDSYFGCWEYRPLLDWKIEDVWLIHRRYGLPRNRLYDAGMHRVGCFPCINSNKRDLRHLAQVPRAHRLDPRAGAQLPHEDGRLQQLLSPQDRARALSLADLHEQGRRRVQGLLD